MFRKRWAQATLRQSVVIHTTTNQSFRGVLIHEYDNALVLRHAALLGAEVATIDGELVVPRERVSFVQVLPASEQS